MSVLIKELMKAKRGRSRGSQSARRQTGPGRVGRRARNKEKNKERILAAALALFQKKGFEGATTKEIARHAHLADGTIFNYFQTKDDIALYFFEQETEQVIASFAGDKRLQKASLEEKLFALIHRQLEFLAPHQRFIGAALVQALKPSSKLNPFRLESQEVQLPYFRFVQGLFEEAARKGEIGSVGWWSAQVFWVYYLGVVLYWLQDPSPGKESTLAFVDRSLKIGTTLMKKGAL